MFHCSNLTFDELYYSSVGDLFKSPHYPSDSIADYAKLLYFLADADA